MASVWFCSIGLALALVVFGAHIAAKSWWDALAQAGAAIMFFGLLMATLRGAS